MEETGNLFLYQITSNYQKYYILFATVSETGLDNLVIFSYMIMCNSFGIRMTLETLNLPLEVKLLLSDRRIAFDYLELSYLSQINFA